MNEEYRSIRFRVEERVGRITLARPPLNVLDIALMREVCDALARCGEARDMVAVRIDAAEGSRAFSAGVSVQEHAPETVGEMLEAFHAIFRALERLALPALAVVDGAALGGGCELVAACDLVVASERATFGQPEIKLGVFPPVAAILLPRVVGERRARELVLTGEPMDAREALRCGLVNRVAEGGQVEAEAEEMLSRLRGLSASALRAARRAMGAARDAASFGEALAATEDLYLNELMKTEDAREGIRAFVEKRPPAWRNR